MATRDWQARPERLSSEAQDPFSCSSIATLASSGATLMATACSKLSMLPGQVDNPNRPAYTSSLSTGVERLRTTPQPVYSWWPLREGCAGLQSRCEPFAPKLKKRASVGGKARFNVIRSPENAPRRTT